MRIKEVITELEKLGMSISFYKRKDGGIRITRINGERYTGSTGNQKAREIVHAPLSELQTRALKKLSTPKGKGSYNKRRKPQLDEETKKKIKKLQALYRKSGKKEGKPTQRNYKYILKTKGKAEADRLLRQSERRILGLAYTENVDALLARIASDLSKKKSKEMKMAYNRIKEFRENFQDAWIHRIYEILYEWEMGTLTGEDAGTRIISIIG